MRKIIIISFIILPIMCVIGQQDAQYTQYMYNTIAVNPAYAGSRGVTSITALYRSQWLGLDGAPTTQTFNIHGNVKPRVGLGLSIVNDEIGNGTNQDTYFDGVFSYTVPVSQTAKLSFGIKAGGHLLNIDFNKLRNYTAGQNVGGADIDKRFSPNIGAGVYYHSDQYYLGVSIPNFLETEHFDNSGDGSSYIAKDRMNLYVISGYIFDLNPDLKFKPAVLLKAVKGAPLQLDMSANFLINQKFSLGAAYRWDAALSILAGFQISDQLMIGISYDKETTELGSESFNAGSFEALIRYEFVINRRKVMTPRFF